jgi:hypothetical protein
MGFLSTKDAEDAGTNFIRGSSSIAPVNRFGAMNCFDKSFTVDHWRA